MSQTTFIYALCEPGTRTVRYIGKADEPEKRLACHLADASRSHRTNWIQSLKKQGLIPSLVILSEVVRADWQAEEVQYISAARSLGMPLVNGTDGGEGLNNPGIETRTKISNAKMGERNPMFGKARSLETLEKLRVTSLGRKQSSETRLKKSIAMRGRVFSEEHKEKLRDAALNRKWLRRPDGTFDKEINDPS